MRMLIMLASAVVAVGAASGEVIGQRPYAHAYDGTAEPFRDDEFVVCADCSAGRPTVLPRLALRIGPAPEKPKNQPVEAVPLAVPEPIQAPRTVGTVHFRFGSWKIPAGERRKLDMLVPGLAGAGVEGYACTAGPAAYNDRLSLRRAAEVAGYLKKKGVPVLSFSGKGESDAFPERRLNRRADVVGTGRGAR